MNRTPIVIDEDVLYEMVERHAHKHWKPGSASASDLVEEIKRAAKSADAAWDDKSDEWTDEIEKAFPTRSARTRRTARRCAWSATGARRAHSWPS